MMDMAPEDIIRSEREIRGPPKEDICTAACDQPSEQHTTSDCPCWQAGYEAGLEAQREPPGRGTA